MGQLELEDQSLSNVSVVDQNVSLLVTPTGAVEVHPEPNISTRVRLDLDLSFSDSDERRLGDDLDHFRVWRWVGVADDLPDELL